MNQINFLVCARCFTYNHAHYIEDAMNGFCMQQTNFPYVCTIVDDCSTDGEQEVIKKYLLKYFDLEDKNVARNEETEDYTLSFAQHKDNPNCYFAVYFLKYNHYSIKKTKFPYFSEYFDVVKYQAMCEGDDYWSNPHKLQLQVDFLDENPEVGMCYTRCRYYFQDKSKFAKNAWGGGSERFEDLIKNNTVPTASVLYRQGLYEQYQKDITPNDKGWMLGDYPFWLWISKVRQIRFLNEETCVYRILEHSASQRDNKKRRADFITSVTDIQFFFAERYNQRELVPIDKRERALLMDAFSNKDFEEVILQYHQIYKPDWKTTIKFLLSLLMSKKAK